MSKTEFFKTSSHLQRACGGTSFALQRSNEDEDQHLAVCIDCDSAVMVLCFEGWVVGEQQVSEDATRH